jgi:hypothetical protein
MRKAILLWSVGIVCVTGVAGCGLVRSLCEDYCTPPPPQVRKRPPTERIAGGAYARKPSHGIVTSVPKKDEACPSPDGPPEMPPKILPDPKAITQPPPAPKKDEKPRLDKDQPVTAEPPLAQEPAKLPIRSAVNVTDEPPIDVSSARVAREPQADVPAETPRTVEPVAPTRSEPVGSASEDFKVLTGRVTLYRNTYRLRYANVDQVDAHGGVVVLVSDGLAVLRDQAYVRVRGELIPLARFRGDAIAPSDRNSPARFRVDALEILDSEK